MKFVEMLGTVDVIGSESKNFSRTTRLEDSLSQWVNYLIIMCISNWLRIK